MSTPEQQARETIDALLGAVDWSIQDIASLNLHAARGVAVREMQSHGGPADYILFPASALAKDRGRMPLPLSTAPTRSRSPAAGSST